VPVPRLARWLLGLGIAATLAANMAHGLGHGASGAVVAAWPAFAPVGSYELLMVIIRSAQAPVSGSSHGRQRVEPGGRPTAGTAVRSADAPAPRRRRSAAAQDRDPACESTRHPVLSGNAQAGRC